MSDANGMMRGGSGATVAISTADGRVLVKRDTTASVAEGATVTAFAVDLDADASNTALATLDSGSGGILAVTTGKSTARVEGITSAFIAPETATATTTINAGGPVTVTAKSGATTSATGGGGSGGAVSVLALTVLAETLGETRAYLGNAVRVPTAGASADGVGVAIEAEIKGRPPQPS